MAGIRLVVSSPELRGEYLKAQLTMQRGLAAAIAGRSGGDPAAAPVFSRALAAAVAAVISAATERWLFSDPPVALGPVVEDGLAQLVAGLRAVLPADPARVASLRAHLRADSAGSGRAHAERERQEPPAEPSG
jgi:MftR C-terminal domain